MSNPGAPRPPSNDSLGASVPERHRPRINRRWLAFVLISIVLLGISVSVMLIGRSSRSDAESDRDKESEQLVSQLRSTKKALQEVQQRRAQGGEVAAATDAVLNHAAQISQKVDQILGANEDATNRFSNPNPSAYNEAIDRADALVDEMNALVDQANAALEVLDAKANVLRQETSQV